MSDSECPAQNVTTIVLLQETKENCISCQKRGRSRNTWLCCLFRWKVVSIK